MATCLATYECVYIHGQVSLSFAFFYNLSLRFPYYRSKSIT